MADEKTPEQIAAEEAAAKAKADADAAAAAGTADDEVKKAYAKLREAEKAQKQTAKELDELKAKLQEHEDAKKSDLEKAQARIAELEAATKAADEKLRQANLLVELSKPEHGLASAQAAAKLLEGVEYDDQGRPSNLDAILPDFLEANAFLKGDPPKPKPAGTLNSTEGSKQGDPPALTAEQLRAAEAAGMTPERYAALGNVQTIDDFQKLREAEKAAAGQQ